VRNDTRRSDTIQCPTGDGSPWTWEPDLRLDGAYAREVEAEIPAMALLASFASAG
jgi:hypothetical protein